MPSNRPYRRPLSLASLGFALSVAACGEDGSQAPAARTEAPAQEAQILEAGNLGPVDLIYVCGNKFLATNSTRGTVHVTYRVVGTSETGGLTLPPGTSVDPGHTETEMETVKQGTVELYRDDQRVVTRRNLKRPCGAHAAANLASATAAETGSWTAPFPWPIVALHMSLIPDGRVLAWGLKGTPRLGSLHRPVHRSGQLGGAVLLWSLAAVGRPRAGLGRTHFGRPRDPGHQHLLAGDRKLDPVHCDAARPLVPHQHDAGERLRRHPGRTATKPEPRWRSRRSGRRAGSDSSPTPVWCFRTTPAPSWRPTGRCSTPGRSRRRAT